MNEIKPSWRGQRRGGVAKVPDRALVEVLEFAGGIAAPHHRRQRLDEQCFRAEHLGGPQRPLGLLPIVDVRIDAVPLEDVAVLVAKRAGTKMEPPIDAIVTPQARLSLA